MAYKKYSLYIIVFVYDYNFVLKLSLCNLKTDENEFKYFKFHKINVILNKILHFPFLLYDTE